MKKMNNLKRTITKFGYICISILTILQKYVKSQEIDAILGVRRRSLQENSTFIDPDTNLNDYFKKSLVDMVIFTMHNTKFMKLKIFILKSRDFQLKKKIQFNEKKFNSIKKISIQLKKISIQAKKLNS